MPGVNSCKLPGSFQGGRILVMKGREGATPGGVAFEEEFKVLSDDTPVYRKFGQPYSS